LPVETVEAPSNRRDRCLLRREEMAAASTWEPAPQERALFFAIPQCIQPKRRGARYLTRAGYATRILIARLSLPGRSFQPQYHPWETQSGLDTRHDRYR